MPRRLSLPDGCRRKDDIFLMSKLIPEDKKLQKELDKLYDRLQQFLDEYDNQD